MTWTLQNLMKCKASNNRKTTKLIRTALSNVLPTTHLVKITMHNTIKMAAPDDKIVEFGENSLEFFEKAQVTVTVGGLIWISPHKKCNEVYF